MNRPRLFALTAGLAGLAALVTAPAHAAEAVFHFPGTPYLSAADIPAGFYAGDLPTFLEDFEDGNLSGGLAASAGSIVGPGAFDGIRDSIDGDDGVLDGTCGPQGSKCRDWFTGSGSLGIKFSYGGATLPTAFGVVWTDGAGIVTLTAYDGGGVEIGSISRSGFADGSNSATTAEDRFFGVTYAGGIGAIKISNSSGGLEIDHLQYGAMAAPVPEPPAALLLAAGGLLAAARVRHRRAG